MFSNNKFYVTNHEYINTGGGCMMSIFTVYDRSINTTRFVLAYTEGFSYQTADTVGCAEEFEHEELQKVVIGSHYWEALTCEPAPWDMQFEDDEWKLFKYCQFEFYKKDCKHHKTMVKLPVEWLSPELYDQLTAEARTWLSDNHVDVSTDGEHVYVPQAYLDWQSEQLEKRLQAIKDFKQWFEGLIFAEQSEEDLEELYNSEVTLTFRGREVKLPFDARVYEATSDMLKDVIEDW